MSLDRHPALLGLMVGLAGIALFECVCYALAALGVFG